jgi:hypothetical protein
MKYSIGPSRSGKPYDRERASDHRCEPARPERNDRPFTVMSHPETERTNCKIAMTAKMIAATRE